MSERAAISLRLRLALFAAAIITLALAVTGFSLSLLFERHLERRVGQELDAHLTQLSAAIRPARQNPLALARSPADPRFESIFGGLYWQIRDDISGEEITSRSLFDARLDLPPDTLADGSIHTHRITGPVGADLIVLERTVRVDSPDGERSYRIAVAIDRAETGALATGFARDLTFAMVLLGLVLIGGLILQTGFVLRPVDALAAGVNAIRSGHQKRLADRGVPRELAPLASEVNALLDAQDTAMTRARDRAADLAQGLKTPLTALAADAERLRVSGEAKTAEGITEVVHAMHRTIDRELARARIRHGRIAEPADLARQGERILRTLARTPDGERITMENQITPGLHAAIDPQDFDELLGTLCENAVRHARSRVRISALIEEQTVVVKVSDDGPGLSKESAVHALRRGTRLDENGNAGLGLAIAGEIAAACGGKLEPGTSDLGGFEAIITLPHATLHT